ncbi:hypothetical protein LI90_4346 (plasmid) [Carbonactinospora thermoautotrophica]|uniref:HTH cro/C1-type domain-containing protein n=1 Tax=Carbonactinospora thermoautotrophica TaxID=1469144 RepID=A0A132MHQ7_9ACTN|nr:helix-turn-helix transcriptional regulator [Carbonactinospora thermoautotrophica]KWW97374.1 hypothetical protein LI90_4346 [Carbonactinospora thermoautotrophica]
MPTTDDQREELWRPLAEQFGKLLVQARQERGISQRGLADRYGMAHVSLGAYERGEKNLTLDKMVELCRMYGLEIEIKAHKRKR